MLRLLVAVVVLGQSYESGPTLAQRQAGFCAHASAGRAVRVPCNLSGAAPSPLLGDLLAYWKMDGTSLDVLGNYNGTDNGVAYNNSFGVINQGVHLGGGNARIGIPGAVLGTTFSISAWIKPITGGGYHAVVAQTGGVPTFYWLSPTTDVQLWPATPTPNFSVQPAVWTHVVISVIGGNATYYLNGAFSNTEAYVTPFTVDFIGNDATVGGDAFVGDIDEVGVWTRALTAPEAAALYNGGVGLQYPF